MKKEIKEKHSCNQCFEEMTSIEGFFGILVEPCVLYMCYNPKCISYGLVQVPAELMPKEKI